MRNKAVRTVLYPLFNIFEVTSALVTECIKRAIAEKTVEEFLVIRLMAGEIYAVFILEIRKIVVHKKSLLFDFFNAIIYLRKIVVNMENVFRTLSW